MKILLKKATIYDSSSDHHLSQKDILIVNGQITRIENNISSPIDKTVESQNLCVSPGWLDIGAFNGEPGYEQRETLQSLKEAGANGGYTYLATLPNSNPVADTKAQINFLQRQNDFHTTEILPIAAATVGAKGTEMAEFNDLTQAGALAFTDGSTSQLSKGQILRTLEYLKGLNGLYIHYLPKNTLTLNGQINEGEMSIQLGLEGSPKVEELINVQEALQLVEYSDGKICLQNISTAESVDIVSKTKSDTTATVPYLNLVFNDSELASFNANLKVWPPLREEKDRKALIKAIEKGTINCISSNHMPIKEEDKDKEFGLSHFGATGLETCFAAINTYANGLSLERLIYCLSEGSYETLEIEYEPIKTGAKAVLTIFDPDQPTEITKSYFKSQCFNNPFVDKTLTGRILGVVNGQKSELFVR